MSFFKSNIHKPSPCAIAVRAYLEARGGIEASWSDKLRDYAAEPQIAPWFNGRMRGFVISLRTTLTTEPHEPQLNIAVYQHVVSEHICLESWYQRSAGPPLNAATAVLEKSKITCFDKDKQIQAANWIYDQLEKHWIENEGSPEEAEKPPR